MSDDLIRNLQRQLQKLTSSMSQLAGDKPMPTFAEFAGEYKTLKLSRPSLRDATKRSFEYNLRCHLVPAFGHLPIDKISQVEWLAWIARIRNTPGTISRFFNARKSLMEVLNAAKDQGVIERTPKLENPDELKNVGRVLEEREVRMILRKTKKPLFRFFFYTLWKMGCRPREILKWEWNMVTWGEPGHTWIDIPARISKCDRPRRIPVNPSVSNRLLKMFQSNPLAKFVFPKKGDESKPQLSYHGAWKTSCRRARVRNTVPYDLRRTFITRAAAGNKPLLYVAKCLDTSTKMIEGVYAKAQAQVMEEIVR